MVPRRLLPLLAPLATLLTGNAVAQSAERTNPTHSGWLTVSRTPEAAGCPDEKELRTLAERLLEDASPQVPVRVDFRHGNGTFVAEITRGDRDGMRRLSDSHINCSALAGAVATVLALLIENEPSETARVAPPAPPIEPPAPTPKPNASPSTQSAGISLSGGVSLAYFKEATPLINAEFFFRWERVRMSLGILYLFSQETPLEPGVLGHEITAGSANLCFQTLGSEKIALLPCIGAHLGVLTVNSEGFTVNSRQSRPWITFPVGLAVSGRFSASGSFRWGWRASASALFATREEEFVIEGLGPGFQTGRISGLLSAGIEGSFGF